jgi:hypothetical protein
MQHAKHFSNYVDGLGGRQPLGTPNVLYATDIPPAE